MLIYIYVCYIIHVIYCCLVSIPKKHKEIHQQGYSSWAQSCIASGVATLVTPSCYNTRVHHFFQDVFQGLVGKHGLFLEASDRWLPHRLVGHLNASPHVGTWNRLYRSTITRKKGKRRPFKKKKTRTLNSQLLTPKKYAEFQPLFFFKNSPERSPEGIVPGLPSRPPHQIHGTLHHHRVKIPNHHSWDPVTIQPNHSQSWLVYDSLF